MSKVICKDNIFVLEAKNTHYVIGIDSEGCNHHIYWGRKCDIDDYEIDYNESENSHNTMLDEFTQEYTVFGSTMYRGSALKANFADGLELPVISEWSYPGLRLALRCDRVNDNL